MKRIVGINFDHMHMGDLLRIAARHAEIVGSHGTISSYDYEPAVRVQTVAHPAGFEIPVDPLTPPRQDPIQYILHCLETGEPLLGPLSIKTARIGQQIVDAALRSIETGRAVKL